MGLTNTQEEYQETDNIKQQAHTIRITINQLGKNNKVLGKMFRMKHFDRKQLKDVLNLLVENNED